ncbi:MAG: hypothetical protein WBW81_07350 [Methylocella sp.]
MTATNTSKPAKDGTGLAFTLEVATESVSGNIAQKTYLGSPSTEALVEPPTHADVAAITTARGTPMQASGGTVGITGTVPLPTGAAQDGTDSTGITQLAGGVGIRGWLSGIFSKLASVMTALGSPMQQTGGSVTANAGTNLNTSALATSANQPALSGDGGALSHVTNFPATQPVSAASLPLPSNGAQETGGNLAAVATAQGAGGTGITQPAGGSGILGWLSGIFSNLASVITALGSPMQQTGGSVSLVAGTAGGVSAYVACGGTTNALLTNTAVVVKASGGNIYGLRLDNAANGAVSFLQLFNLAAGSVVLGTTVPADVIPIPAGGYWEAIFSSAGKLTFSTRISCAVTTTRTGSTAPVTGVAATIYYL